MHRCKKAPWTVLLAPLAVLLVGEAEADEPAPAAVEIAVPSAEESFTRFAQDWMDKIRQAAKVGKQNPTLRAGPSAPRASYTDYANGHQVELRPTGNARAPYVGVLRYQELVYACRDATATDCVISSRLPVTEIFRYQDGRWVY